MRVTKKKKDDPHLIEAHEQVASAKKPATRRPKRSKDQRLNLKRSYEAFLEAARRAGDAAASIPSPSETWPARPYAASV